MDTQTQNKLMMSAGVASVTMTTILIVLKAVAFVMTSSMAILSSLFDSIQDLMTSTINAIAIRHAIMPADNQHRFGHGKAQGIGSLIQVCIITMAAIFLAKESVQKLLEGHEVVAIDVGIIVTIVAIIMTLALVRFQKWVILHTNSLCVKTDMAHYTGDILMNIGVLLSLGASYYLGWMWLDSVFGICVSIYLLYSVYGVLQEAFAMLMDKELPERTRNKIKSIALSTPDVLNVSSLKTRRAGNHLFIQFSVQFDGQIRLNQAHKRIDEIEEKLCILYPDSEVIIHPEPFIQQKKNRRAK